jgi:hypothetical protein
VKTWPEKHPRFHLHFTPTSVSWLNLVERWFGEITRKRIRRGVFKSVPELVAAIDEFIRLTNKNPKPFVWTKTVKDILNKIKHCKAVLRHSTSRLLKNNFDTPGMQPCKGSQMLSEKPAGWSKRPSSKAAASEEAKAYVSVR